MQIIFTLCNSELCSSSGGYPVSDGLKFFQTLHCCLHMSELLYQPNIKSHVLPINSKTILKDFTQICTNRHYCIGYLNVLRFSNVCGCLTYPTLVEVLLCCVCKCPSLHVFTIIFYVFHYTIPARDIFHFSWRLFVPYGLYCMYG